MPEGTAAVAIQPDTPRPIGTGAAYLCAVLPSTIAILLVGKLNLALPALERSIGAGPAAQQMVLSLYALGFGLSLVPFGRLGDSWSRRGVLLIGLGWLAATETVAGFAQSPGLLITMRVLQGVGAGMVLPQTTGIMQDIYSGERLARAYGGFGAAVGVSSLVAPSIGGVLLGVFGDDWGWRLNFWIDVPLLAVLGVAGARTLPANSRRRAGGSPDLVGLTMLAVGVLGVMTPFTLTGRWEITEPLGAVVLIGGVVALVVLMRWEGRVERDGGHPVISPRLLRLPTFRNGVVIGGLFFLAISGSNVVIALHLQTALGLSALHVALLALGGSVASAFSAWIGGRHSYRRGRAVIALGLAVLALGLLTTTVVCAWVTEHPSLVWLVALTQALSGLGAGLITAPNQSVSMMAVPREEGSVASSVFQVSQRMGTAIGVTVVLHVYFAFNARGTNGGLVAAVVLMEALLVLTLVLSVHEASTTRRVPEIRD